MLFDDFRYFAPDFTEWHFNSYCVFVNVNEALMAYFLKQVNVFFRTQFSLAIGKKENFFVLNSS